MNKSFLERESGNWCSSYQVGKKKVKQPHSFMNRNDDVWKLFMNYSPLTDGKNVSVLNSLNSFNVAG